MPARITRTAVTVLYFSGRQILRRTKAPARAPPSGTGCLGINGVVAGSDDAEAVRRALIDFRAAGEARLRERFERAKAEGDLPETTNCEALAAFVMAVSHGMAVQAKAGFSRERLESVAEQALCAFPADR